jgi:hypothetical protein
VCAIVNCGSGDYLLNRWKKQFMNCTSRLLLLLLLVVVVVVVFNPSNNIAVIDNSNTLN